MNIIPKSFYLDDIFDNFDSTRNNNMKCDIYEKDGDYHIEIDIPGFDKKDIKVECDNGYLTVTAKKDEEAEDKTKNYIRRERSYGKYQRSFYIGDMDRFQNGENDGKAQSSDYRYGCSDTYRQ